jgi:hypothetical protein
VALAFAAALLPGAGSAQTGSSCQFILGFKSLHDLAPSDIGDCTDSQAFASNGDAQQHTTKGLMAWRKSDNWTAFTNGYQTWLNGPQGLAMRLNTDRFPWESDGATDQSPAASGSSGPSLDLSRLPLGDNKYGQSAQRGSIFSCQTGLSGGGAFANGPWIHSDNTWDAMSKISVAGQVPWSGSPSVTLDGSVRHVTGNGLPSHNTGIFPISSSDPASRYDRNPNSIRAQTLRYDLPANPTVTAQPTCVGMGAIGIMLTGPVFYNGMDAGGRDAAAHEIQDACDGHPDQSGMYHYHSMSPCADDSGSGHSKLIGYAFDGFGIYGPRGDDGRELTDADLDECHGRTDTILWDGVAVSMYHYVATREFPYTIGCYRGTPLQRGAGIMSGTTGPGGGSSGPGGGSGAGFGPPPGFGPGPR